MWTPKPDPGPAVPVAPVPGPSTAATPATEGLVRLSRSSSLQLLTDQISQTQEQQTTIMELSQHTNLTLHFSQLCLVENGWNAAAALANFQALHAGGGIPPEAFRPT